MNLVAHSTASMGKFDEQRKGEPERKTKGIRRKFKPVVSKDGTGEKASTLSIMNRVMGKRTERGGAGGGDDNCNEPVAKKVKNNGKQIARKGRGNKLAQSKKARKGGFFKD